MSPLARIQRTALKQAALNNAQKELVYRGNPYRVGFTNGKPPIHGQATYRGIRYVF